MGSKIHRNSLKPGHKINSYEIIEVLGQGGFGITYLANDTYLNRKVAIKEYLPIELAVREGDHSVHPVSEDRDKQFKWGLDRFLSEAQTLAQFKHPNIVQVYAVFEANNTGYMVMAYEHGQSLQEKLAGKKTLEESELLKILIPILGGLEQVHKTGFIHRDIKPDNIFIREDGSPVLLDFGSARQALGEQTKTLTSLVSPGYAPFEQYYSRSDQQGPWTDIYGLGATLYRAVAGVPPVDAVDRSNAILKSKGDPLVLAIAIGRGNYSERFLHAIDHALQFKEEDRPQTITAWKAEFDLPDDPIKKAVAIERTTTQPGTKVLEKPPQKGWLLGKALFLGVIISVAIPYIYWDEIKNYFGPTKAQIDAEHQRVEEEKRLAAIKQKEEENLRRKVEEQKRAEVEAQRQAEIEQQRQEEARKQEAERLILEAEARRKQDEEKRQKEEIINNLLSQAEEGINALRLTSPEGGNAQENYNKVLELDPENTQAKQGMQKIADKYIELARQATDSGNFEKALANLDRAEQILPNTENIKTARKEIELKRKEEETQLVNLGGDEVAKIAKNAKTDTSSLEELIRLADINNLYAQSFLGLMYINGQGGLPKDEGKARELYEKSAAQGNALGQNNLGAMYQFGQGGLPKDEGKARELYEKSAAQGNAFGQNNLGAMYQFGQGGLPKDEGKARELYEKSAAQGNALGQYNLGVMYQFGQGGLPKDEGKARELYEQSAAQGNTLAINALKNT